MDHKKQYEKEHHSVGNLRPPRRDFHTLFVDLYGNHVFDNIRFLYSNYNIPAV